MSICCLHAREQKLISFGKKPVMEENENFFDVYLPHRNNKCLKKGKKFLKSVTGTKLLSTSMYESTDISKTRYTKGLKEYKPDLLLMVIKKLFEENNLTYPIDEVFLLSEPGESKRIITTIKDYSRLFTLVSPVPIQKEESEIIYKDFAIAFRQVPEPVRAGENSLTVILSKYAQKNIPNGIIMDLREESDLKEDAITLDTITFSGDSRCEKLINSWGGTMGVDMALILFEEMNLTPKIKSLNSRQDRAYINQTENLLQVFID